jgi:tRNA-splicing ligase RtcB (3'-phosphate/5'-hydroxy nucleic acid ligase)
MFEHTGEFEWRGEGEGAEIVLYAPDAVTAERAFEQTMPAAGLPGVVSPVHASASSLDPGRDLGWDMSLDLGWVTASETHAAPDLISAPARGLLLVAGASAVDLGVSSGEAGELILRNLSEVSLPRLGGVEVRRAVEGGALWAAEEGLILEEDLELFGAHTPGEPDALTRRALVVGARGFDRYRRLEVYEVTEILDTEGAEALGLIPGALVLSVRIASEDLGRLTFVAHRERILRRVWSGDFGATAELPAAPLETEEATDLLAAVRAVANYADARAALRLYELRRALAGESGISLRAAWRLGGLVREEAGSLLHRRNLASVERGNALVTCNFVAVGTGAMRESAPPFGPGVEKDTWAWEEAELLERISSLELGIR